MRQAKVDAARRDEFTLLQEPPKTFEGRVWGCKKWASGCADRIVETPPYADQPPDSRCGTHGLPMTTKTAERRTIGTEREAAR